MRPPLKVLTINLLNDLSRWEERKNLLAQGLRELQPDLVALQEIKLPLNTAQWLADQLNDRQGDPPDRLYTVYLCPKVGRAKDHEGIAILSRFPVESEARVDLRGQNRVAQYIRLKINDRRLIFANTHLYWEPGESPERLKQVERLVAWLRTTPADAVIVCGDFNGEPGQRAIKRLRKNFTSAHQAHHGLEPSYTCPTPLTSKRNVVTQTVNAIGKMFLNLNAKQSPAWRGTLDYIFVNDGVQVKTCDVVLNQPAPHDPTLYPSDHFGLCALLDLNS